MMDWSRSILTKEFETIDNFKSDESLVIMFVCINEMEIYSTVNFSSSEKLIRMSKIDSSISHLTAKLYDELVFRR
jgi:hypothetical protein